MSSVPKIIAFYLPQFHAIPENDRWWGKGFTEWTNVTRAYPLFNGHYQPQLPSELGFYDLTVVDIQRAQAQLAKEYGVYAFSFYYYWFAGKKLLEKPIDNYLNAKDIDFPFCLTFANENWTRRWDGREEQILIAQNHSLENERAFAQSLLPYVRDERYVRVGDRPLINIYRSQLFPDIKQSTEIWRDELAKHGIEPYLCKCQTYTDLRPPEADGFDAAMENPPHFPTYLSVDLSADERSALGVADNFKGRLRDYEKLVQLYKQRALPNYKLFRSAMTSWDNTARRLETAYIYVNAEPTIYQSWLEFLVRQTARTHKPEEQFIFVNAWNEWAEGACLEPNDKYLRQYLEATKAALTTPLNAPDEDFSLPLFEWQEKAAIEIAPKNVAVQR